MICFILIIVFTLQLSACSVNALTSNQLIEETSQELSGETQGNTGVSQGSVVTGSTAYRTFENALRHLTTDVVIAQYVGHSFVGTILIEYEFIVLDRIVGNATDRIFVLQRYDRPRAFIEEDGMLFASLDYDYIPAVMSLNSDTEYLLALFGRNLVYNTRINEDVFGFGHEIVIDLNDISNSTMDSGLISEHSTGFDFNRDVTREEIISYVYELTKDNPPGRSFIRSNILEEILEGASNVLVVEITDPISLARDFDLDESNWKVPTDAYKAKVIQILKGDYYTEIGDEITIIFFAETVFPGEHHLLAVEPVSEGSFNYDLTARTSLFEMEQLEEIMTIIKDQSGGNDNVHDCNITGHIWEEWDVIVAPTCTIEGSERRDCLICDEYETRMIDADPCGECVDCVPELTTIEYNGKDFAQLNILLAQGNVILTSSGNFTIPDGSTLTIPEGKTLFVSTTLNVRRGTILDISGTVEVFENRRLNNDGFNRGGGGIIQINEEGVLINHGYIESESFSSIFNDGTIINNGTTGNHGRFEIRANTTFINNGTVNGSRPLNIHRDAILS